MTGALFLLVYAISHTDVVPWTGTSTLVVLGASVALLATFVWIEARVASHPLVPLRLFRVRSVTGANLVMFSFGIGTLGLFIASEIYTKRSFGGFSIIELMVAITLACVAEPSPAGTSTLICVGPS